MSIQEMSRSLAFTAEEIYQRMSIERIKPKTIASENSGEKEH